MLTSCYDMSAPLPSQVTPSPGTFSLLIAPPEDLTQALEVRLSKDKSLVLYMCGNYPLILPGIFQLSERFVVRRALPASQILTILYEAFQSFIICEHDRSLFEERADLLPVIGHRCREYAIKNSGVLLISTCPDRYIYALEPFFHRIFQIRQIFPDESPAHTRQSKQLTLGV